MLNLQTVDQENEQRRRLEQAVALAALKKEDAAEVVLRNKTNQKKAQVRKQQKSNQLKFPETIKIKFLFWSFSFFCRVLCDVLIHQQQHTKKA